MGKMMRSLVTIQHSPVAQDKAAREDRRAGARGMHEVGQKTINPGDTFNPADLQLTDADVERMKVAGHIVDADDKDALRPGDAPSVTSVAPAVMPPKQ